MNALTLSSLKPNLWLLSPACQPYTVLNPNAKGADDPRAQSFIHLFQNVLPELALLDEHPDRLFIENVAGFEVTSRRSRTNPFSEPFFFLSKSSSTQHLLLSTLRSIGYTTLELLLTPLQFGIPNSRLRYYLLAKKSPLSFPHISEGSSDRVWRQIPGFNIPLETDEPLTLPIREYLDVGCSDSEHLFVPDRVLEKRGRLFDIVLPSSKRTCCFTRGML